MSSRKLGFVSILFGGLVGGLVGALVAPLAAQKAESPEVAKNASEQAIMDATGKILLESNLIRDKLLAAIEINGRVLSPSELKRETVFLTGTNLIELKILELRMATATKPHPSTRAR